MGALAPLDRLAPEDFYHELDHLADDWDSDEYRMAKRLLRLRRHFEHLPTAYWRKAEPLLAELARARIVANVPWRGTVQQLRLLVSEWAGSRPPLLECDLCGVELRGHRRLLDHRYAIHGIEEDA